MSVAGLHPLSWDSTFFGLSVARLVTTGLDQSRIADLLAQARSRGIQLLYWVAEPDDATTAVAAEAAGAQLLDRKATFVEPLAPGAAEPNPEPVPRTFVAEAVTPGLLTLALQSGTYSRFRLDAQLPADAFERLYAAWLDNSVNGKIAGVVLATKASDGAETGLLTLVRKSGWAEIGLLAVNEAVRRRGVGALLIGEARQLVRHWGCSNWQVVTQLANTEACDFYQRLGFQLARVEHVYHLWLPANDSSSTFATG